jgi:hypothetical protein
MRILKSRHTTIDEANSEFPSRWAGLIATTWGLNSRISDIVFGESDDSRQKLPLVYDNDAEVLQTQI